jgi:hypothetical protein
MLAGKFLSANKFKISRPTLPVAPATAIFLDIILKLNSLNTKYSKKNSNYKKSKYQCFFIILVVKLFINQYSLHKIW